MMTKRKQRPINDLYHVTQQVPEPEMTAVLLKGNYCGIKELKDENKKTTTSASRPGKRLGSHFAMTKAESGTCNVCAAPCSMCRHMEVTDDNEFSDEVSRVNAASRCSSDDAGGMASLKKRECLDRNSVGSETSNLASASSSHDSISENAESKASLKNCDTNEDVEMLPKVSLGEVVGHDQHLNQSVPYEVQNVCNGADVSCVSGANDSQTPARDGNVDVERENQLCSTASVSNFTPEGFEKKCNNSKAVIPKLENSKSSLITSSSSGSSMKDKSRLEAGTVVEMAEPPTEAMKQLEPNEKSRVSPKVSNNQDPPSKSQHDDVSDESEILEDDVKVCDICGDAGREDLLAICSRCSDGAEHTYCMRIMMDKVPEGDWLCEVCQLKEAAEKQKDKCEPIFVNAKASCINEKSEKYVSTFDSKNDPKLDTRFLEEEVNETTKAVLSPRLSSKRQFDNLDVSSIAKRRAIESNAGSPMPSSPNKTKTLSRESSFKNVDKGKVKPKHPLHSSGVSSSQDTGNHVATSLQNSSKIHPQFQSPQGSLSKSSSFNTSSSKHKVKMVHEDVSQKNKLGRHPSTTGSRKEGLVKAITKSSSFQIGRSHLNSVDFKAKSHSSNFTRAEDLRGIKVGKERNKIERKNSFRSDHLVSPKAGSNVSSPRAEQKVSSRGETMTLSSATKFRDLKPVQSDVRSSKSSNLHAHRGSEAPNTSGGRDFKRQSSLAPRSVGYQSFDRNSAEQKSFEVVAKDENVENLSCSADGPGSNFVTQDGLPQSRESIGQDKRGEEPSFRQSRQSVPAVAKSIRCLKCKEIGHAAQVCPNGSIHVSVLEATTSRSSREVIDRSTSFKDANEAVFMKNSGTCKKSGLPIQSDELSSDGADERKSSKNSTADFNRSTTVSYVKHDTVPIGEAGPSKAVDLDAIVSSDGKQLRPCSSDLRTQGSSVSGSSRVFFIPEQEYIWQGGFEVLRSGQVEFYDGMQAHLSTCVSPKVVETVNKLPHKLLLEEVSRSSTWPTQFQNCVTEDNIALYFFANDVESYLRSYQSLVENLMKNDLALKGVLDGVELLIFPSNQLCEKSKRWNMLYFLWGVFRGRRVSISQNIDASTKSLLGSKLNEVSLEEELPSPVIGGTPNESSGTRDYDMPAFGRSLEHGYPGNKEMELGQCIQEERENICIAKGKTVFLDDSNCRQAGVGSTSPQKQGDCPGSFTHYVDESSSLPLDAKTGVSRMEMIVQEGMNKHSGFEVTQRDTIKNEEGLVDADFMLENKTMRSGPVDNEQGTWVVKSCHKRPYSTLLEKVPQASDEPSVCTSQLNSWKAKSDGIPFDGENDCKKLKKVHSETYSSDGSRHDNSMTEWQLSQRLEGASDGTVMPASSVTTERYFFPIDSSQINYVGTSGNSIPVQVISSDDEDQLESDCPNLDLALGGEKKSPKKRMEPLFEVFAKRKNDHGKCPEIMKDNEEDDDALGSLSLSLAAPFPGKMVQRVKPPAKQEPESSHIDTSLILFGGFPGT